MTETLGSYRGRDILKTAIAVRGTGDGLSEAMEIDPVILGEVGDEVTVALRCRIEAHDHKLIKGIDALALKQVLRAGTATIIDDDLVAEVLDLQAARIGEVREAQKLEREKASGVRRLGDDFQLGRDHLDGRHAEAPVDGCPVCHRTPEQEEALRVAHAEGRHDGAILAACPTCEANRAEDVLAAHASGLHPRLMEGCPECDEEVRADQEEAMADA